ncbi:hypothetical protein DSL72_000035 [Monilinia vaccinii-corymbosi]|uniref:Uncharacterized protein n=1 Tax=Monilinia vaccinii-corymbosi TaxID=61207 RepID=A0A8A3P5Q0_9HELO|nr:hypothetical protein DSL72_000035 [Monilinia vaccinii-corymbosi]
MVKFASFALFALISALTAQACQYCQCEFSNGSHCCVYSDPTVGNLDCPTICKNAHRADGYTGGGNVGTPCNSGGKYKCASAFTALDRSPCYAQG